MRPQDYQNVPWSTYVRLALAAICCSSGGGTLEILSAKLLCASGVLEKQVQYLCGVLWHSYSRLAWTSRVLLCCRCILGKNAVQLSRIYIADRRCITGVMVSGTRMSSSSKIWARFRQHFVDLQAKASSLGYKYRH